MSLLVQIVYFNNKNNSINQPETETIKSEHIKTEKRILNRLELDSNILFNV